MENLIVRVRHKSKRCSTQKNYYSVWKAFNQFFIKLDVKPASWEERLTLYVGYLIQNNKKSSTVRSYISAIKAVLREDNITLSEDKYLLSSLTKACRFINDKVQTRLPIQKGLLRIILNSTLNGFMECGQVYLAHLYRALFASAYYGMLRVGELTSGTHPVLAVDVHIAQNKNKILFILRTSKTHWKDNKPQLVKILGSKNRTKSQNCPFVILNEYVKARPLCKRIDEPFFIFKDSTPVRPENMREVLKMILKNEGFNESLYGTHGFRSGMASDLAKRKISIETIKSLGRWRSNSVYTYLR